MATLQSLVNLNNQVSGQVLPLLWSVDQAQAEATPKAAALAAQQSAIGAQFRAARTADQLNAVAASVTVLQGQIAAELAANQCGHPVGAGKVITISLSLQEMVFYQDGCVVKATPVTTGRPQLRTPTGTFSIFYKKTPLHLHLAVAAGLALLLLPEPGELGAWSSPAAATSSTTPRGSRPARTARAVRTTCRPPATAACTPRPR